MQNRLDGKCLAKLKPGMHSDGNGLALKVQRSGSRSWVQRLKVRHGPNINLGLGGYPVVGLAEARTVALENKRKARQGINPRSPEVQTFVKVAKRWLAQKLTENPDWYEAPLWERRMAQYVRPRIGNRPIDSIEAQDVTAIRDKCKSVSTAKRVVSHVGEVLRMAEAEGLRVGNPCPAILAQVKTPPTKHREWISADKMIPWMQVIADSHYPDVIRRIVRFLHFLPMRLDEVREMGWEEVHGNVWTIAAKRMKARTPFRVMLPAQAKELMGDVRKEGFVWALNDGNAPNKNYTARMKARLKLPYSAHGIRHNFETWGVEHAKLSSELVQRCTAHSIRKADQSHVYQHYDYVDECAAVYAKWIRFLTESENPLVKHLSDGANPPARHLEGLS